MEDKHPPIALVLDNVRSGHNVGATFRIADALGAASVYLCGITPTPPHREIRKTALGAEATVPWQAFPTVTEAIIALQQVPYDIVAVEQVQGAIQLQEVTNTIKQRPTALIFGHEVWGVSQEALSQVDTTIEIPQQGEKKSLNVSTCIAIVAWEWQQRRS